MEQTEQGLFGSKLNETGKNYIRKFAAATRILLLIGVLVCLVFLTENIIRLIHYDPHLFSNDKILQFEYRIFPFYAVIYTVLALLQLYYYWKVGRDLKKGGDFNDEVTFNAAFSALYRNAVFSIITFSMSLLINLLDLYVVVKLFKY